MLNYVKVLFNGEKVVRKINRKGEEILIDQLVREDLELDEKERIAESVKKMMDKDDEWEEHNSEFWYKYGVNEGKIKGMMKAAVVMLIGYTIGRNIYRK